MLSKLKLTYPLTYEDYKMLLEIFKKTIFIFDGEKGYINPVKNVTYSPYELSDHDSKFDNKRRRDAVFYKIINTVADHVKRYKSIMINFDFIFDSANRVPIQYINNMNILNIEKNNKYETEYVSKIANYILTKNKKFDLAKLGFRLVDKDLNGKYSHGVYIWTTEDNRPFYVGHTMMTYQKRLKNGYSEIFKDFFYKTKNCRLWFLTKDLLNESTLKKIEDDYIHTLVKNKCVLLNLKDNEHENTINGSSEFGFITCSEDDRLKYLINTGVIRPITSNNTAVLLKNNL